MQLHMGGKDKGEQKKKIFILKLIPKIKSRQNGGKSLEEHGQPKTESNQGKQ